MIKKLIGILVLLVAALAFGFIILVNPKIFLMECI